MYYTFYQPYKLFPWQQQGLVVKVWVGIKDKFDLLIDWDINLMGLVYFADKVEYDFNFQEGSLRAFKSS